MIDQLDPVPEAVAPEPGLKRRTVEWGVAIFLLCLTGAVIYDNLRIGAGWGDTGPRPGYFPMRIASIVAICAIAIAWQARRTDPTELFASWRQLKTVAQLFVPLAVYVAVIGVIGIYVSSALFIAAFMMFAGHYRWLKSLLVSVITVVILFVVFEIQFKVPLPKGPLEAWFGY